MASESPTISIKLLIDQEANVVLLAEAGNDFVDTLHSLFKLPLGNFARLADKHQTLQSGCLKNIYNSVENLGLKFFRTEACKRMLLCPRHVHDVEFKKLKLNMDLTGPTEYFVCGNESCNSKQGGLISYYNTTRCSCGKLMNTKLKETIAVKDETEGVLLKEESMFFITDDLRVVQGFPGELLQFLHNRRIKNLSQIEEKVVEIGSKEMTNLFIHSLISNTTLTDLFLGKERNCHSSPILAEQVSCLVPDEKESTEKCGKIGVKMMLRKSDRRIVLVEASEDFVDLLFSFLTIPLESVLELVLGAKGNVALGSISNLFSDLNTMFSISNQKNSEKGVLPPFYSCPIEFPNIRSRHPPEFRVCYSSYSSSLNKPLDPKSPNPITTNILGYVKKNFQFVVTDDLVVQQLRSVSSISLLKELGISLDDVELKVVSVGVVEAIALLGACLLSSRALSASFVGKSSLYFVVGSTAWIRYPLYSSRFGFP